MDPRVRFNLDGEGGQRQRTGLERAAARNALMPQLRHDPPKPPCHGPKPPAPVATVALAAAARVAVVTVTQVEAMPLLDHAPAPLRRLALALLDAAGGWDTVLTAFPPILLSPDPTPDRSGIVIARHIARVSCAAILAQQAAPAARLDSSARFGRLVSFVAARFMAVPFVAFWVSWFECSVCSSCWLRLARAKVTCVVCRGVRCVPQARVHVEEVTDIPHILLSLVVDRCTFPLLE
jgi:hypothetical protein